MRAVSKLARLLRERMQMLKEDALAVAAVVEEAFAGSSELDDDMIDPQVRSVFYDLQDEKILSVERREYERDGQRLRGFFWRVDESDARLDAWAPQARPPPTVYDDLREAVWQRRPRHD